LDSTGILIISGLLVFTYNYIIGWLVHFKIVTISKTHHQLIYAVLVLNLVILLIFLNFLSNKFLLYSLSLLLLISLPIGEKGGIYHRIISTFAFFVYLFTMLNYQFFRFVD
jgi:hypothetical protein